jgi:hypothetical protein
MNPPQIFIDENADPNTVYLVPSVDLVRYKNLLTGEIKEFLEFNAKAGGVIKNVWIPDSGQEKI